MIWNGDALPPGRAKFGPSGFHNLCRAARKPYSWLPALLLVAYAAVFCAAVWTFLRAFDKALFIHDQLLRGR
jgi:hypothetical protein